MISSHQENVSDDVLLQFVPQVVFSSFSAEKSFTVHLRIRIHGPKSLKNCVLTCSGKDPARNAITLGMQALHPLK